MVRYAPERRRKSRRGRKIAAVSIVVYLFLEVNPTVPHIVVQWFAHLF
jgi:hypothetical protein